MATICKIRILAIMLVAFIANSVQAQAYQQPDTTDWQQLIAAAKHYREHNNTHKAIIYAQQAMALHPCDTVRRELAVCNFARGNYNACINICHQLLTPTEVNPEPDSSEVYLIARCFEKMEWVDSMLVYQSIEARRNIENQANTASYARSLIAIKMYSAAITLLENYCAVDSGNMFINNVLANAYYNAGKPTKAINMYEKLVEAGDTRANTLYYLAMACLQRDKHDRALECLTLANEKANGTNALTLAMLGLVQLDEVDSIAQVGEENIIDAIDMMQPNPDLLYRLYSSLGDYYITHNFKTAIKYFKQADEVKPNQPIIYYQIGYCYYMIGDEDMEYKWWNKYIDQCGEQEATNNTYVHFRVVERLKRIKEKRFMEGKESK